MPPERRGSIRRLVSSDLLSLSGGKKKPSEDKTRKNHDSSSKVNSHEFWLDTGKKDKDRKEKDKKDKEKEREREAEAKEKDKSSTARKSKSEMIKALQKEKETLGSQIRELQDQLQSVEERDRSTQTRSRILEDEIQALRKKTAQDDEEIQTLVDTSTRAAEAAERHIQDVEHQNQSLQDQLRKARDQMQKMEAQAKLLQQRERKQSNMTMTSESPASPVSSASPPTPTADLRGIQVFMSKADSYAGAEIIRMVETLNAEILQCAAFVAESIMAAEIRVREEERTVEKCRKRSGDRVGQRLTLAMKHNVDTDAKDPLPLQLALQHTILVWSCHIVQSFTPESQDLNKQLTGIWGKVAMKEEPAVAGKWRAIMAAQLRGPSTMYRAIYDDCKYIMVAGGWSTKAVNATALAASIQARLMAVESSIMKLKEAVIEGVTSTELVPCMWPPGHLYDPAEMDSAYPDPTDPDFVQKPIVCSTDLGVKKLAVSRLADGSASRRYETLLKTKVILPSALDDDMDDMQ